MVTTWWKRGIVYQIYPRSFQDTNGDGIGDLDGIMRAARLSRLARRRRDLDLADLSLADGRFRLRRRRLLRHRSALRHARRLRPPGRRGAPQGTQGHPRLRPEPHLRPASVVRGEPQRRATSPKRDWYIWRDPAPDGGPPNNWLSNFGGPAWTCDEATGQYYYHAFLKEQPDLNWRNPDVRAAMHDVAALLARPRRRRLPRRRDLAPDQGRRSSATTRRTRLRAGPGPDIDRLLQALHRPTSRRCTRSSPRCARGRSTSTTDRVLIGEIYLPLERLVAYYGAEAARACICRSTSSSSQTAWNAAQHRRADRATTKRRCRPAAGRTGCSAITTSRASRAASAPRRRGSRRCCCSRCAARRRSTTATRSAWRTSPIPPERVQDPLEKNEPGLGLGRDPERTPMQWDASRNCRLHRRAALAADRGELPRSQRRRTEEDSASHARALSHADHLRRGTPRSRQADRIAPVPLSGECSGLCAL